MSELIQTRPGPGRFEIDPAAYSRLVRGEARGARAQLARGLLSAASVPYRLAVAARNLGYDRGWIATYTAAIPVVSVGNLTAGGTGKTPMVEWLARWQRRRGRRVVVLSRGYKGAGGTNDEGRVLEENLPDVPHLQDRDRTRSARVAVEELEAEILLLDDGFQHRRLARNLDIVLLDALDPFGLGRLLPRGLLREPIGALKRAGAVVLTRADLVDAERRAAIRAEAERRAGPIACWAEARHAPLDLVDAEGRSAPLETRTLAGRAVAGFCGIGNPEGFRRTLVSLGAAPLDFRIFPDHHAYSARDVDALRLWARDIGADLVLTTQKDLVKLRESALGPAELRAIRIGLEILAGEQDLDHVLARLPGRSVPAPVARAARPR